MIWFTSDTHFGHENVLKFTDRPWETIQQMNSAIVANINARVGMNDELYILGDFSFKMTAQDAYGLRKKITCKKVHLVPGNHDSQGDNQRPEPLERGRQEVLLLCGASQQHQARIRLPHPRHGIVPKEGQGTVPSRSPHRGEQLRHRAA